MQIYVGKGELIKIYWERRETKFSIVEPFVYKKEEKKKAWKKHKLVRPRRYQDLS